MKVLTCSWNVMQLIRDLIVDWATLVVGAEMLSWTCFTITIREAFWSSTLTKEDQALIEVGAVLQLPLAEAPYICICMLSEAASIMKC